MIGNQKNVLGIIPARYNSSRLKGKPLALIDEKPMIQHVYERASKVLNHVKDFISNGVDIIDLGAQSTRPGAEEVGPGYEIKRLIPYLKIIRAEFPEILISIDTFNSDVAYEALLNGANWINDVTGV